MRMPGAPRIAEIDEAQIDRTLAADRLTLTFPPSLEALYEEETARKRSRSLAYRGLLGIAVYLLFLVTDYLLVPDVLDEAIVIRATVVGLGLRVFVLLLQSPPRFLREGITAATSTLAGFSQLYIMLISESAIRVGMHTAVALVIVFVAVVQRLYIGYATAACLALLAGHATAVLMLQELTWPLAVSLFMVSICMVGLALIGSWSLSREMRRSYLLDLKQRRANLYLAEMSLRDPLTSLENRRALDAVANAVTSTMAGGEDLAAVLLDIDHFKSFNDTQGHMAGDVALQRIADLLRASLRSDSDHAFRFGGEEFLLILPRTGLGQATRLAERLRQAIETEAIPNPHTEAGVLTASFGVAARRCESASCRGPADRKRRRRALRSQARGPQSRARLVPGGSQIEPCPSPRRDSTNSADRPRSRQATIIARRTEPHPEHDVRRLKIDCERRASCLVSSSACCRDGLLHSCSCAGFSPPISETSAPSSRERKRRGCPSPCCR
jgi:diguanylate cyclase (GGDEF)-like protein